MIGVVLRRYGVDVQGYGATVNALSEAYRLQQQRDRDTKDAVFKTADVKLQNASRSADDCQDGLYLFVTGT